MSARVARHWPANGVVVRRAIFLAFDGEGEKAREALGRALITYPGQREIAISLLQHARLADPIAIEPLLVMARNAARKSAI